MLPNKVLQLDYQDIAHLLEKHTDAIIEFEQENNFKFDLILAKLRNGAMSGSILANRFQLPMGVVEMPRNTSPNQFRMFLSHDIEDKLKQGKHIHLLFVDGICGTGRTLEELKIFLNTYQYKDQINVVTYCTLVDASAKTKPDIIGLEVADRFFQPPWEWRSFTPQAHLDRLEIGHIKASNELECCVGFSSQEVLQLVEEYFERDISFDWTMVFNENEAKTNTTSGISSFETIPPRMTLDECLHKYKQVIAQKAHFIEQNGLTHFIEEDLNQALLISEMCPVCHIIYIEKNSLYRIFAKETTKFDFQS